MGKAAAGAISATVHRTRDGTHRFGLVVVPLVLGVVAFGALVALRPLLAVAVIGVALLLAIAFMAPVVNLVLIIFTTAIVPFTVQNRLAGGSRGLILSDVLLGAGLLQAAPLVARAPLGARTRKTLLLLGAFLVVAAVQFLRSALLGRDLSVAGTELRTLLGFATFLVALPIVRQEETYQRLLKGLIVPGLALGLWGIAQWLIDFGYEETGFGVRGGIAYTTAGRGQLQGGLFEFGVAALVAFSLLVSTRVQSLAVRMVLVMIVLINLICLLLTYERTFWLAATLGFGFVLVKADRIPRARTLVVAPAVIVIAFAILATLAPSVLGAARERLLSLGQYASDSSLQYRLIESRHVVEEIQEHPVVGSGLAATIVWGRPWHQVPPRSYSYSHNGYLWLAWKLGLPVALAFCALLLWVTFGRAPVLGHGVLRAARSGAQAALFLLVLVSVTFPAFNTFSITPTMGLLIAMSMATPSLNGCEGMDGKLEDA